MYKKQWIAANITALVKAGRADNVSSLAVRAGFTKPTLTTFIKNPEIRNVNIDLLIAISEVMRIEPWVLLMPDFPVDALGQGRPPKRVTHEGYRLLSVFESLPDDKRKAILDFAAFQTRDDPASSRKIEDVRIKYAPREERLTTEYPKCDEKLD